MGTKAPVFDSVVLITNHPTHHPGEISTILSVVSAKIWRWQESRGELGLHARSQNQPCLALGRRLNDSLVPI